MKKLERSSYRLLDISVLLLAWGIRLYRLGFQSIWWDEGRNINAAMQPISRIPHAPAVDIHPPLYFYLLHFWLPLGGHSEFAIRFLSAAFGFLTLPILYRLGEELFDRDSARFVLLLAGIAPFFVGEAQEARMYTLAFLWITLAGLAFWKAWKEPGRLGYWALFGAASALAMLTHYSSIFVLAAFYLLGGLIAVDGLIKGDRRPLAGLVVGAVVGTITFLPQASTFWHQVSGYYNRNLVPPGLGEYFYRCWQAFTLGENVSPTWVSRWALPFWMLTIPGMLLALWKYRKKGLDPWAFLATWIVIPLGLYYWQVLRRGAFEPRYISFIAPAWWLVLAAALAGYLKTRKWAGAVALVFFLGAILPALRSDLTNPKYFRDNTRGVAKFLKANTTGKDVIIIDAPFPLQFYYTRFSEDPMTPPPGNPDEAPAYYLFANVHTISEEMRAMASGKQRVFLVHWYKSDADPRGLARFLLSKYGSLKGKRDFRGYRVEWYVVPPDARYEVADRWKNASIQFRNGLVLESFAYGGHGDGDTSSQGDVDGTSLPADKPVWVALDWRADKSVSANLKASVFLEDFDGHKVGQDDRKLLNDRHVGTRFWKQGEDAINVHLVFPIPATAPGKYRLMLTLYDPHTGKDVPVLDPSGAPKGVVVELGQVVVIPPVEAWKGIAPQNTVQTSGASPLGLQGYDDDISSASPGGFLDLRLYWVCHGCSGKQFRYDLVLANGKTEMELAKGRPVSGPSYPVGSWRDGETVAPWYRWVVPADAPTGSYEARICWGDEQHPCAASAVLGKVRISGRAHSFREPGVQHRVDEAFGGVAKLVGYSVRLPSGGKGKLHVTLVWKAIGPTKRREKVFVHVLDSQGKLISQQDSEPCGGRCPVTGWLPGEFVQDEYVLPEPAGGWNQAAALEIGMYDLETEKRISTDPPLPGDAIRLPLR